MSYETKKIGSYSVAEKDIDLFIKNLPREQQAYGAHPKFREQVAEQLEQICLFAMLGEEYELDKNEAFVEAMQATRRDMLGQYAIQAFLNDVEVNDQEVAAYYVTHRNEFTDGKHANASHILVETEEEAQHIKEEIESGAMSFEDAARQMSTCPSSQNGGSLGDFGPGQMVPEFDAVVFSEEIGKIVGPVKTQFGYHLILINSRSEERIPELEEIKDQVRTKVLNERRQEEFTRKLEELKKKYME